MIFRFLILVLFLTCLDNFCYSQKTEDLYYIYFEDYMFPLKRKSLNQLSDTTLHIYAKGSLETNNFNSECYYSILGSSKLFFVRVFFMKEKIREGLVSLDLEKKEEFKDKVYDVFGEYLYEVNITQVETLKQGVWLEKIKGKKYQINEYSNNILIKSRVVKIKNLKSYIPRIPQ